MSIADYELRYLVILRLALNEPAITYIGSPNPSTFLRLIDVLNERREMLLRSLATGTFELMDRLAPSLQKVIADRLKPLQWHRYDLQRQCVH